MSGANHGEPCRCHQETRDSPRGRFGKAWIPKFFDERPFNEDVAYIPLMREEYKSKSKSIILFSQEPEIPVASSISSEIAQFCGDANVDDLSFGDLDDGLAWLDDRAREHLESCECVTRSAESLSGCVRRYQKRLNAALLLQELRNKVRNKANPGLLENFIHADGAFCSGLAFQECPMRIDA
jgi:hypothetical protein